MGATLRSFDDASSNLGRPRGLKQGTFMEVGGIVLNAIKELFPDVSDDERWHLHTVNGENVRRNAEPDEPVAPLLRLIAKKLPTELVREVVLFAVGTTHM